MITIKIVYKNGETKDETFAGHIDAMEAYLKRANYMSDGFDLIFASVEIFHDRKHISPSTLFGFAADAIRREEAP